MIRREPALLHPRLTVVPVADGSRPVVHDAPGRTVVGHAELRSATRAVAERRRAALRARATELRGDLELVEARLADADATVEQRRADRDAFIDAAAWAEALPGAIREQQAALSTAEADLHEHLRASRDAARALDRVLEQRASADAAISEARRQLRSLGSSDADPERQKAAAALATQAESVEARLADAEAAARARSDQTKRTVTEAERTIEGIAREQRERLGRLRGLVECLPADARPPRDDDPLDHADAIGAGLRALADSVDGELAGLTAVADRCRADRDHRRAEIEGIEAAIDRVEPDDAAEALADLVTGVDDGIVVLDDVVADDGGRGLLGALERTEPGVPVVLLSADPAVLGWAIDLPADRGAVAAPGTVELLVTVHSELVAAQPTVRPSMGENR